MKKRKDMFQIKRQGNIPEKKRNEVEIGNLPETKFKIMLVKMIQNIEKTIEKIQKMFTKT